MKIFAIGDLHLGHAVDKPMDIFGPQWKAHVHQIATNWQGRVRDQDLVLIPGDVSWAMRFEEAEQDLVWLDRLPGRKVLLKGNHDYWWPSISRLRERFKGTSLYALQYDSISISGATIGGSRLWTVPELDLPYEDPLEIPAFDLLSGRQVAGWPSGRPIDSEATMQFSTLTGVRAQIETYPLEQVGEALQKVLENKVRFRAVLVP